MEESFFVVAVPAATLRFSKPIAIGTCIAIVAAAYYGWYVVTSEFNPNPPPSMTGPSCSAQYCGRFGVLDANLTVINATQEDILSQYLGMGILPSGNQTVTKVQVLLDNVTLGFVGGPFPPGKVSDLELGVPTSIIVNPGQRYTVLVGGYYEDPASPQTSGVVWVAVGVVASG